MQSQELTEASGVRTMKQMQSAIRLRKSAGFDGFLSHCNNRVWNTKILQWSDKAVIVEAKILLQFILLNSSQAWYNTIT